jgi:polyribonucleotide nucleotidyltransferase
MAIKNYSLEFAGKPLFIEIGRLANQANGSCLVRYGETTILATATMAKEPKGGVNYFPLSVDYEEKYYAAGRIKGSKWIKRETRPSEEAILTARLIDRSLRPRFNQNIRNDIQIVITVLSFDGINDPDIPALFGASLALMISDIPFDGPVAAVRVGRIGGKLIFNPTYEERQLSDFDIVVAGPGSKINMIEAGAKVVPEEDIVNASARALDELQELIKLQKKIAEEIAPVKKEVGILTRDENLARIVREFAAPKLEEVLYTPSKTEYVKGLDRIEDELNELLKKEFAGYSDINEKLAEAKIIFEEEIDRIVHKNILEFEKRPDGRRIDELREVTAEVSIIPRSHGTGLFNRGATQALTTLTLAAPGM